MQFQIGRTTEEHYDALDRRREWHAWFAWYPARIGDGRYAWLEPVERRLVAGNWDDGPTWIWEYRARPVANCAR